MARKRATGRFYFLLILLLAVAAYFLYQHMPSKATEGVVSIAVSSDTRAVDAVIVRNEAVFACDGLERVEYLADEGSSVQSGTSVANVYTTSYISKEFSKLQSTRESIRTFQQDAFSDIEDSQLERLVKNIRSKALEVQYLVNGKSTGNLYHLEKQMQELLNERRQYCNESMLENTKLIQLFQDETNRLGSISTWCTNASAVRSGTVSFYFDGYEELLTADSFQTVSIDILRKVFNHDTSLQTPQSSRSSKVYRIVDEKEWFVALISKDASWSPVSGQVLSFQLDGFDDLVYNGTVTSVQRSGNDTVIRLSVTDPIGPLLYQRSGRASVGVYTTGLSVPADALYYQNNQAGVWVRGTYGVSFIPVEVLSQDGRNAIVQPMQTGSLYEGQAVMIY